MARCKSTQEHLGDVLRCDRSWGHKGKHQGSKGLGYTYVYWESPNWCNARFGPPKGGANYSWNCRLMKGHAGHHDCPASREEAPGLKADLVPLRGTRVQESTGIVIPLDTCQRCECDIEWFNGTWWVEGTCVSYCGDPEQEHQPTGGGINLDQIEARDSQPVRPKRASEAARKVFGR